jgi:hypothetical protein
MRVSILSNRAATSRHFNGYRNRASRRGALSHVIERICQEAIRVITYREHPHLESLEFPRPVLYARCILMIASHRVPSSSNDPLQCTGGLQWNPVIAE